MYEPIFLLIVMHTCLFNMDKLLFNGYLAIVFCLGYFIVFDIKIDDCTIIYHQSRLFCSLARYVSYYYVQTRKCPYLDDYIRNKEYVLKRKSLFKVGTFHIKNSCNQTGTWHMAKIFTCHATH